jgi:hypothetical protein
MASEAPGEPERSYRVRTGCAAMGCAVLFLVAVGSGGAAGLSTGCAKIQNGQGAEVALGWAMVVLCGLATPALLLAPLMLVLAVRETLNPQFLRITTRALHLPEQLRGNRPKDENGQLIPDAPPPQPEEIPFAAIKWIRREDGPGGSQLLIVHDLSPTTLIISQINLNGTDFEELQTILKAAVPAAFAAAPPQSPPA